MCMVDSDEHVPREERALDVNRAPILPTSDTWIGRQKGFNVANLAMFGDAFLVAGSCIHRKPLARLMERRSRLQVFPEKTSHAHRSNSVPSSKFCCGEY